MLELADEARAELTKKTHLTGSLTIRVPESFCVYRLTPVIERFHERMPNVKLRFVTCAQEGLGRDLRKGITDLAFLLAETIRSKDLSAEILGTERLVFIAAPNHPLAQHQEFRTEMLADHTLLLSGVDCSYRRTLEHDLAISITLNSNIQAADLSHKMEIVRLEFFAKPLVDQCHRNREL